MPSEAVPVTFLPCGSTVDVVPGTPLLAAARAAEVSLVAPCGGRGQCGLCAVRVVEGELDAPGDVESAVLAKTRRRDERIRLACRALVGNRPVTVMPLLSQGDARVVSRVRHGVGGAIGAAVDLGTTNVSLRLIDMRSGSVLADGDAPNRQAAYGADVVSRIEAAISGEAAPLAEAARSSIMSALAAAMDVPNGNTVLLDKMLIAANPAMAALLLGVDVSTMAAHPFVVALQDGDEAALARSLRVTEAHVVPAIDAFVGGDLVAGAVAAGLTKGADGLLYVDIGTNVEVAFALPHATFAASAPAGPAFEGVGISCGGGAGPGGITRVSIDGSRIALETRGLVATHFTSSGMLSALDALRSCGQLDADGTLRPRGPLADRLFASDGIRAIALGEEPEDRSIYLTQLDIRTVQSAKAAVAVAVSGVLDAAGEHQLAQGAIVSGALGAAIDSEVLVRLGLLPSSVAGNIVVMPDAVLSGAAAMLVSDCALEAARHFAQTAKHVDLAAGEGFSAAFMSALQLKPYMPE
ncbi:MAG: DUF4445 domain-containing protein [Clostridiales bacterium]|nr:DUF4445 domain-containing protein [Clostridiales bacterium]